ncbi:hypothetical protein BBK82_34410 [Lentzea guizhouensis]|uniref:SsuA/THI5-like domain-containing protein n=1 Tax=Lentzea guizhouensis TaxID=1586287 RepID=A0A1B2HRN1_9PSEU|nr:ABC transporter substrate-binding protein [Lentzea guizhouensis]ANZ40361.1 hypothetical protein BBK82_34410 [Lentzea guizhouensis]
MTTTRRNFLGLSLLGLTAATVGCSTAAGAGVETKTLRYQGWAGDVTLPELAAELGYLGDVELEWVGNTISGPQDIQSAATGQVDFGGAFNGAVVKLKAAGAPIKSVIGYYGSDENAYSGFYVLDDSPVRTARDLLGKKVGMNTLGAHHEAMLGIYLKRAGLGQDEIKKVEPIVVPPVNTEQSVRQKQIEVGVLGGILRDKALEKGGVRKRSSCGTTPARSARSRVASPGRSSGAAPRRARRWSSARSTSSPGGAATRTPRRCGTGSPPVWRRRAARSSTRSSPSGSTGSPSAARSPRTR